MIVASTDDSDRELGNDTMFLKEREPKSVNVAVHLHKWFFTSYGINWTLGRHGRDLDIFRPTIKNERGKRQPDRSIARNNLSLLLHGTGVHSIRVETYPCAGRMISTKSVTIRVQYTRWEIDGGGFYAYAHVSDEKLTTVAVTPTSAGDHAPGQPQTQVLLKQSGNAFRSDTGVSLNFYPANYPYLGFIFGIAANNNRSPTYILGVGPRLLSFGRRAALSASFGVALIQTLRFPGVAVGQAYPSDSPLLNGTTDYRLTPFMSIHLGFSVGGPSTTVASGR